MTVACFLFLVEIVVQCFGKKGWLAALGTMLDPNFIQNATPGMFLVHTSGWM